MVQTSSPPPVDVQALMREIRSRVRGENREHEWIRQARRAVPGHLVSSIGRLRSSTALLRGAISRIGQPPPSPATWRGRLGAMAVRLVQRSLFWYTPTIQNANGQIVDALESHLKVTEEILAILERTSIEIARVSETSPDKARRA